MYDQVQDFFRETRNKAAAKYEAVFFKKHGKRGAKFELGELEIFCKKQNAPTWAIKFDILSKKHEKRGDQVQYDFNMSSKTGARS